MLARDLSVVIPHYGEPGPTRALVAALRDQEAAIGRLQIVVSDDASPTPFPPLEGVEVVRRQVNGGFGSAVNSGAELAVHPLLLVLNSDLELPPTFLADLLGAARRWLPAVVSPRVVGPDGSTAWPGRHFPTTCPPGGRVAHPADQVACPASTTRSVTTPPRRRGRTPSSTG